jgi:hypothetical protein
MRKYVNAYNISVITLTAEYFFNCRTCIHYDPVKAMNYND